MWALGWWPNHKVYLTYAVEEEAAFGGRGTVYVRACPACVAHILIPVGTGLGMGLPSQVVLGRG